MRIEAMKLEGLTSDGCIETIMQALNALGGVQDVVVSLLRSRITVEFDEALTGVTQIAGALSDRGYRAV